MTCSDRVVAIKRLLVFLITISTLLFSLASYSATPGSVLILYDSSGPYGSIGKKQAILLQNLLGHFDVNVSSKPVTQYVLGDVNGKLATFYIGSTYMEQSYYSAGTAQYNNYNNFLADVAKTSSTVVWMNYNLWQLAWSWNPAWGAQGFNGKFGIAYSGIVNNGYNRVKYKNTALLKGVVPYANPGSVLTGCISEPGSTRVDCSLEINQVSVIDPAKAKVFATTYSTLNTSGTETPYITKANNLWVIGDMPFVYISEEDRYLAFADVLHDILGDNAPTKHLAIVRLEDVSADTSPAELKAVTNYLNSQNVKFSVATIPNYVDPTGYYNGGVAQNIPLNSSVIGINLRNLANAKQASIVQHGTTHQFGTSPNPFTGTTGDDFEFYKVVLNPDNSITFAGPVAGDSTAWAQTRTLNGKSTLNLAGLSAFAWEAPHYFASKTDYAAIKSIYPIQYSRLIYYSDDMQPIGQFFPYLINKDTYGFTVIPENIGNIEPDAFLGYRIVLPEDLIRAAKAHLVVRDGVVSFFYHPYLGTSYLQQLIQGIKAAGYTFVAPCSLVNKC